MRRAASAAVSSAATRGVSAARNHGVAEARARAQEQVQAAGNRVIDAGARFLVSPALSLEVIEAAHQRDVPILPGCFSPTEILTAWNAGADIVKLFPATALGPTYIRDLHGPLPHVKVMPTGGVSIDNAAEWIRAGAAAVSVGSALLDPGAIASGDYGSLTEKAARLVTNVNGARAHHS